jgi:hypothetical protein
MTYVPKFTQFTKGEATENQGDEERILADRDETLIELEADSIKTEEKMEERESALNSIENEPEDFMRGEVDVKSQMDRAAREMEANLQGHRRSDHNSK